AGSRRAGARCAGRPAINRLRRQRRGRGNRERRAITALQAEPGVAGEWRARLLHPPRHSIPDEQQPGAGRATGESIPAAARPGGVMGLEWASELSLGQWALVAGIPAAVVALYFLKLRRRPLVVPSTYLWQRAIEDLHVNSLWQRLRRSLLLLL